MLVATKFNKFHQKSQKEPFWFFQKKKKSQSIRLTLPNIWTVCPNAKLGRNVSNYNSVDYQCPRSREKLNNNVSFPLFREHWRKSKINHFPQYIPKYFWQAVIRRASYQYFWYWIMLTNLHRRLRKKKSERYIVDSRNQSWNTISRYSLPIVRKASDDFLQPISKVQYIH